MAQQNTTLIISHRKGDLPTDLPANKSAQLVTYAQFLEALGGGMISRARVEVLRGSTDADAQCSRGTCTVATALVNDTVTIGGVVFTAKAAANAAANEFSQAGTDTVDATSLADVINASTSAGIAGIVRASNLRARVTCTTTVAHGDQLVVAGCLFEMVRAVPDREGRGDMGTVLISAVAATMATNLAAAMNAHPAFGARFVAIASSAIVSIFAKAHAAPADNLLTTTSATGLTLTDTSFAAQAVVCIFSLASMALANAITLASSGATLTVSGTRLTGGVGGDNAGIPPTFLR